MGAVGGTLLGTSLQPMQLRVYDLDTGNPVAVTVATKTLPDQILIRPDKPLRSHHKHAVVWMKGVKR